MLKKIKNNSKIIILILLFAFFILISAIKYSNAVFSDITNSVFRFHVIANSDSKEDQELKIKVRDSVLEYINSNAEKIESKQQFIKFATEHQTHLQTIAQNKVKEEGYSYNVTVEIGNFYFPTKIYNNITLPSGNYDGLEIKIGKAEGRNWWCVMFPPLCLLDNSTYKMEDSSLKLLEQNLSKEEFSIITENTPTMKFKFKILELFN